MTIDIEALQTDLEKAAAADSYARQTLVNAVLYLLDPERSDVPRLSLDLHEAAVAAGWIHPTDPFHHPPPT